MDYEFLSLIFSPLWRGIWLLVGYLTGNAFPHPLSPEEEQEALRRMALGDQGARELLIERNLRLVAHVAKKFDNTGEDPDDLIQIGTVGLIKGVDTYRPEKGTRLATYAARCIENEILMHLRTLKRTRNEVSLYDPIGVDREGNEITLMDILSCENDVVPERIAAEDEFRELISYIERLGEKERKVIELRFGITTERRTQREIARILGISRSYVSRIEKRAAVPRNARGRSHPMGARGSCRGLSSTAGWGDGGTTLRRRRRLRPVAWLTGCTQPERIG